MIRQSDGSGGSEGVETVSVKDAVGTTVSEAVGVAVGEAVGLSAMVGEGVMVYVGVIVGVSVFGRTYVIVAVKVGVIVAVGVFVAVVKGAVNDGVTSSAMLPVTVAVNSAFSRERSSRSFQYMTRPIK